MPSVKTPSALEVGPGRLPANVVSTSALPPLGSGDGAPIETAPPAVISVFASRTLTRLGPNLVVLVDGRPYINAVPGSALVDAQTFTLNDGVTATVFEFDDNATVTPGRIAVPFTSGDTESEVAQAIFTAINGSGSGFVAGAVHGPVVPVTNTDIHKSVLISDTVADFQFTSRSSNGALALTFPDPQVGDTITVVETTPNIGSVVINARIHEKSSPERLVGSFGSRTFVGADDDEGWVATTEKPAVQEVHVTTSLVRSGMQHLVLCDTTLAAVTVTLPENCLVGDKVTVVRTAGTSDLTIEGAGSDTIDANLNVKIQGGSTLSFQTFLCVAAGLAWVTLEESQSVVEITGNFSAIRECRHLVVLAHTSDPAWGPNANQVNLPGSAQPGDRVTVIDVDGALGTSGEYLRIQPTAQGLNGQSISWDLYAPYSAITCRHVSGDVWVIESQSQHTHPRLKVQNSAVLLRMAGLSTVCVDTFESSWTDADTITLPAAPSLGDIVFVTDLAGDVTNESLSVRKVISVIPAGAATINGSSVFRIGGGHGSAAFLYADPDKWVTVADGVPQNAVYNVFSSSLTVPRVGPNVLVRVNPGGSGWDSSDVITLPTDAILGDRVTICQVNTGDSADQIRVAAGAGNTINGYLTEYAFPLHVGTAPNVGVSGVATFRKVAALVWLVESQFGPNEIATASNDLNLTRTSANMTVRVNTAAGTWDGSVDRITLPSTAAGGATPGDKITVFDSDGLANAPTKSVIVDGGTINGLSTFPIDWAFGAATFILGTTGTWVATGNGGPGRFLRRTIRTAPGSGTHTLLTSTRTFRTSGMSGGGGGGGVQGNSAGIAVGAPGTSGVRFERLFTVAAGDLDLEYEIGAGGAGGVGAAPGTHGGVTEVTYNGSSFQAGWGEPGDQGATSTTVPRIPIVIDSTLISSSGAADLVVIQQRGSLGFILTVEVGTSGNGGPNFFGGYAHGVQAGNGFGGPGMDGSYGGGGSGAAVGANSSGANNGGKGGDGILIVDEYS